MHIKDPEGWIGTQDRRMACPKGPGSLYELVWVCCLNPSSYGEESLVWESPFVRVGWGGQNLLVPSGLSLLVHVRPFQVWAVGMGQLSHTSTF